jgi:hypothetical protein
MKLSLVAAVTVAGSVSMSVVARADDDGQFARAWFDSSATHTVVHEAACSFDAVSTFDARDHVFDVFVGGERCPNRVMPAGAIPLFVTLKHGDADRVVVEAVVPADVDARKLQMAVVGITSELHTRVVRASQPPAPQPTSQSQPPSIAPPPHYYGWTRESGAQSDWYKPHYKRTSPARMAGGIVLITGGSLAMFGGMLDVLSNLGPHGDVGTGGAVLGAGILSLVVGIPMLVAGAKKIPAVTASVSPTGGNLRVTF